MKEIQIVYSDTDERTDKLLERIGIKTIRERGQPVRWHYKNKTVYRPQYANHFEDDLLEHFNVKIIYRDKNQLSLL